MVPASLTIFQFGTDQQVHFQSSLEPLRPNNGEPSTCRKRNARQVLMYL